MSSQSIDDLRLIVCYFSGDSIVNPCRLNDQNPESNASKALGVEFWETFEFCLLEVSETTIYYVCASNDIEGIFIRKGLKNLRRD